MARRRKSAVRAAPGPRAGGQVFVLAGAPSLLSPGFPAWYAGAYGAYPPWWYAWWGPRPRGWVPGSARAWAARGFRAYGPRWRGRF
jgi:hypothetical protein